MINSDLVLHDIIFHLFSNGVIFMAHLLHGRLQMNEQLFVVVIHLFLNVLQLNYSCRLPVAVAPRILVSSVRVITGAIGLLRVTMRITHTTSSSIRPMSTLRATTALCTGSLFVA